MGFEQATIKVEKQAEFAELKSAIERVFRPEKVETFLRQVVSKGLRIREFDSILARRVLEYADKDLKVSKVGGLGLYQLLSLSDQALMREFYLSHIEELSQDLRARYRKIYRYY